MIASPIKDSHSQLVHNKSSLEHSLNLSHQYKLNSTTAMSFKERARAAPDDNMSTSFEVALMHLEYKFI